MPKDQCKDYQKNERGEKGKTQMKRLKEQESGAVERWFEEGSFNISDKKLIEKIKRIAKDIR
jgi:hypothetical protein